MKSVKKTHFLGTMALSYVDSLDVSHSSFIHYAQGECAYLYELFTKGQTEAKHLIRVIPLNDTRLETDEGINVMKIQKIQSPHFVRVYEHAYRIYKNKKYSKKIYKTDHFVEKKEGEQFQTYFQIMEKIEGSSLKETLFAFKSDPTLISQNILETIKRDLPIIFEGLLQCSIIHNDLHLHNMMLRQDLTLVCIDFDSTQFTRKRDNKFYQKFQAQIGYSLITMSTFDILVLRSYWEPRATDFPILYLPRLFSLFNLDTIEKIKNKILEYEEIGVEELFSNELTHPLLHFIIKHKDKFQNIFEVSMPILELSTTLMPHSKKLRRELGLCLTELYTNLKGTKIGIPELKYNLKTNTLEHGAPAQSQSDKERYFTLMRLGLYIELNGAWPLKDKNPIAILTDILFENFDRITISPKEWLIQEINNHSHLFATKNSALPVDLQATLDAFKTQESLKDFCNMLTIKGL